MKKKVLASVLIATLALGVFGLFGCSSGNSASNAQSSSASSSASASSSKSVPSGDIAVYSREDGSGTRGAFIELFGIEQKDSSCKKVDMTTSSAAITNSTSVMMTTVAGDENGIGYISLGSLNDTVKAVDIDGAKATAANVKDGSYKVSRPFNIVTKDGLSPEAQDFIAFIMSPDGQKIVEDNGYISAGDSGNAYTAANTTGKIVVAGSSSVTPVMEKLAEAYKALNPDAVIEVQQSDSTTGVTMATDGSCEIGMASRELKDSEKEAGVTSTVIAKDGIAVIVNKASSVDNLTTEQVKAIYTGELLTWEKALA